MTDLTPEKPWDGKNPAVLRAHVEQHAEDYCEDVNFEPYLRAWEDDRKWLGVLGTFVAKVRTLVGENYDSLTIERNLNKALAALAVGE